MGLVYADIELINSGDVALARKAIIHQEEIKRMTVNIQVNSGVYNLCINENIREQLQLPFIEKRKVQLANGTIEAFDMVGPVNIKFKNRSTVSYAMVLKGENGCLLGTIPMGCLDVIIDPLRQELLVNPLHPYYAQVIMK